MEGEDEDHNSVSKQRPMLHIEDSPKWHIIHLHKGKRTGESAFNSIKLIRKFLNRRE